MNEGAHQVKLLPVHHDRSGNGYRLSPSRSYSLRALLISDCCVSRSGENQIGHLLNHPIITLFSYSTPELHARTQTMLRLY